MNNMVFLMNLLLAAAWGAVTGSFTPLNLIFGFILSSIALFLIREQIAFRDYFQRGGKVLILAGSFFKELVLSSWRVLMIVIKPKIKLHPGIIAVPLSVSEDFEITLLANMVTLTPGTLSVDVSEDRKVLFVHCLNVPDPEETIDGIKNGFERQILEAFR
ncbi:Na+/H+ antiporter subunit E [Pseudovibrio ascidiaceicola]|jgi:multicomponent Na+:H+ antiporter subunit E|uniref:Multisubunit sodium/proton antiporter, MrpE subunit (TC 2.A.63.1) n=1 Tax=Pseudovibrio ascidiaceicola TaxID=285279 RepID=A0A1I4DC25_9HYPH|nr:MULTISPECIES: Na+/H+ antiporter subunit E [Pseudovibrio]KZL06123.1 Na(+)/H(+) antiporter subunit E [Pseudovibrio sp. Ad26]KZL18556.1 Na(+)/H(+) antiporter subunit E [Pseudovibrio sp. WM33]KZL25117.1 Na(+)/H(+) antiporter subunit E [Pseudovibrio sp. Ad37]SFK90459.1 multisubunit sodium/proton antiporter, MrpE subunit (TC 2.A.63.1) [Pseudovibrio ascidiaceicola]